MGIIADTQATYHGGKAVIRDDPAEYLPGWPGTNAVLQSRKVNFTLTNLGTTVKTYVGGIKADIVSLATFYAGLGATVDIEEGPVYKLTVTLPWDEFADLDSDPTKYTLWEVTPHAIERSIYDAGIYSPAVQGGLISSKPVFINKTIQGAVEQAYKNPMQTVNLTVNPAWSNQQYIAENYLTLRRLRVEGVQAFTQTVKRTLIINTRNNNQSYNPIPEIDGTTNVLLCKNDFVSFYNIPSSIQLHMLPSYSRIKSTPTDSVMVVGLAGYLAKKPIYQMVGPNKIQLTQEFVWDEWLDALYRPYGGNYAKFPQLT